MRRPVIGRSGQSTGSGRTSKFTHRSTGPGQRSRRAPRSGRSRESVTDLHRDFTVDSDDPNLALVDDDGHGTHVAGIIAGGLEKWESPTRTVIATQKRFNPASPDDGFPIVQTRE